MGPVTPDVEATTFQIAMIKKLIPTSIKIGSGSWNLVKAAAMYDFQESGR